MEGGKVFFSFAFCSRGWRNESYRKKDSFIDIPDAIDADLTLAVKNDPKGEEKKKFGVWVSKVK